MSIEYFAIGKINKPHGIKGEIKVSPLVHWLDWNDIDRCYLGDAFLADEIISTKNLNNAIVIKMKRYNPNDGIDMRNQTIYIDKADYAELFEDSIFVTELVGYKVLSMKGDMVGYITQVQEYGPNVVLTISADGMSYDISMNPELIGLSEDKTHLIIDENMFENMKM